MTNEALLGPDGVKSDRFVEHGLPPEIVELQGYLHAGYVDRWTDFRRGLFFNRTLRESDFAALLAASAGAFEETLLTFLLHRAGLDASLSGRRLVRGSDLRRVQDPSGRPTPLNVPDLFVGEKLGDGSGWRPLVAVEMKFGAYVNGGWGYCPSGDHSGFIPTGKSGGYSNQIVCYLENCWLNGLEDRPLAYVWLSQGGSARRGVEDAQVASWPRSFAGEESEVAAALAEFKSGQEAAWGRWHLAHHEEIVGENGCLETSGDPKLRRLAQFLRSCAPFAR